MQFDSEKYDVFIMKSGKKTAEEIELANQERIRKLWEKETEILGNIGGAYYQTI